MRHPQRGLRQPTIEVRLGHRLVLAGRRQLGFRFSTRGRRAGTGPQTAIIRA
jgi:hypothetical protein